MTNLRKALEQDKLEEFIAEHENDDPGDADKAEKIIRSMAGKSSEARKASSKDCADD